MAELKIKNVSFDADDIEVEVDVAWRDSFNLEETKGPWDAVWVILKHRGHVGISLGQANGRSKTSEAKVLRDTLNAGQAGPFVSFLRKQRSRLGKDYASYNPHLVSLLGATGMGQHRVESSVRTQSPDSWLLTLVGKKRTGVGASSRDGTRRDLARALQHDVERFEITYVAPGGRTGGVHTTAGFHLKDLTVRHYHARISHRIEQTPERLPEGVVLWREKRGMGLLVRGTASSERLRPVMFQGIKLNLEPLKEPSGKHSYLHDNRVWAHGIQMVFVPGGAFWLGDPAGSGTTNAPSQSFYRRGGKTGDWCFQVKSEKEIQLGKELAYPGIAEDYPEEKGPPTIPKEFPKGYAPFLIMKSHVSQGEYAAYINALPSNLRMSSYPFGGEGNYRFTLMHAACMEGVYRAAYRPRRPCNWLNWNDGCSFANWVGLRPMTELEFEKACRGSRAPVIGEYAWGTSDLWQAAAIVGNESSEAFVIGNCNYGAKVLNGGDGGAGPVDDRAFRAPSTNTPINQPPEVALLVEDLRLSDARWLMGATACGALGMSGNLWEVCVTVGSKRGLKFRATHGNGDCTLSNPDDWPDARAEGMGFRGGSWFVTTSNELCVADRTNANAAYFERSHDTGFRGALSFEVLGKPVMRPASTPAPTAGRAPGARSGSVQK